MAERQTFQDHFSGVATSYAASRPAYPTELFEFVARSAPSKQRAWDCATGSGQAAVGLSRHFEKVYGTDGSSQQIGNAASRDNIEYSVQLSENTDFPQHYFDAATIAQALHWFDLDAFTRELARVLKPEGVVMAWTYGFFRIDDTIDAVVRSEFLQPIEPFWPRANASAWSGYSDIDMPFTRIETPEFRLACSWSLAELMAYLSTWSAASRYTERHGPGLIEYVSEKIAAVWNDPELKLTVNMDFYVRGWRNEQASGGGSR